MKHVFYRTALQIMWKLITMDNENYILERDFHVSHILQYIFLLYFFLQPGPAGSKKDAFDADFDDDVKPAAAPTSLRMRHAPKVRRTTTEGGTPWDEDVTKVSVTRDAKPV